MPKIEMNLFSVIFKAHNNKYKKLIKLLERCFVKVLLFNVIGILVITLELGRRAYNPADVKK